MDSCKKESPKCAGSGWHSGMTQEDTSRDGGNLRDNLWFYLFIVWPGVGRGGEGPVGLVATGQGMLLTLGWLIHTVLCSAHSVWCSEVCSE